MPITTMTGREFNRDVSKAKRQARQGPVVITSRGRAAHVLLTMEKYVALTKQGASIVDLLAMPRTEPLAADAWATRQPRHRGASPRRHSSSTP